MGLDVVALAKALSAQKLAKALSLIGKNLSGWNCATGLATTFPESVPYTYENGAYFLVANVAAAGSNNYKPTGTTYTGTASTTRETGTVELFDMYRYNGNGTWELLKIGKLLQEVVQDVKVNGTSVVDANGVAQITQTVEDTISAASWSSYTGNADRVYLYED